MTSWDGMWVSCPRKAAKMARQQLQKVHHVLYKPGFWGILSINIMFRGSYNNLWRRSDGVIFSEVLLLPASWLLLPWSVFLVLNFRNPEIFAYKTSQFSLQNINRTSYSNLNGSPGHGAKSTLPEGAPFGWKTTGKKKSPLGQRRPGGIFCSWIFMVGTNTYIYIYIYMLIWNRIKCDLEAQGKFPNLGVVLLQVDEHPKGWMFTDGINPLLFDVFN